MEIPERGPLYIYILPSSVNTNSITITVDGSSDTFSSSISGEYLLLTTNDDYNWNDTHTVNISCVGYQTASGTTNTNGKVYITLLQQPKCISNLSDGTNTYVIKDSNAIHSEDVTSVYYPTGTSPLNGIAVKSAIDSAISSVYKPAGSVAFANRPSLSKTIEGNVYNITDNFTTTSDFVEGAGKSYPVGTNIVCINTATSGTAIYKWDVLAGIVDLSNYQTLITSTNKLNADLVNDSSSTNKFVTSSEKTSWNNKVDITGNQDVDGIKTFLKPMYSKLEYLDLTTTPSSTVRQNWIRAYDKNGTEVAVVRSEYSTDNSLNNSLTTIRQVNNSTIYSSIYTGITADGKKYQGIDFPGDANATVNQIDTVSARNAAINAHHDSTKQDKLTTGSNIDITNNVISVVDDNFVHKAGTETITGVKTFSDSVSFLGDGDAHCIYIGKNTPINVSGTNQTVLGMINSRPTLGNTAYSLQLRGSATRPSYNNSDVALLSDVSVNQDELVSGTNIKTINNQSILGSGDISITGLPSQTSQSGKFLTTDGKNAYWGDTSGVIIRDWSV